jgi:predicted transcriptional regulator
MILLSTKVRLLFVSTGAVLALHSASASPIEFENINVANLEYSNQGFKISGAAEWDRSGMSVSAAGDVNGDGISDILIGAPNHRGPSYVYVIYGKAGGYRGSIDLATLNPTQGFKIVGGPGDQSFGASVSSAGDVNGDGLPDILIGASQTNPFSDRWGAGVSYVIYGKAGGYKAPLELASLNPTQGFKIIGAARVDYSGRSVSGAGDMNGDGLQDILIGAYNARPFGREWAGTSYVIYGKVEGYTEPLDLASFNSTQGFRIVGAAVGDAAGGSVSVAGDVNGDGLQDILIGASGADPSVNGKAGASYVIYGKVGGYTDPLDLASLNSTQGFKIGGAAAGDYSGNSVSGAGDVNGDGIPDILIGASQASPYGRQWAGASYVIYGKVGGYTDSIHLATLNATQGFRIDGANGYTRRGVADYSGGSVSGAGDVNGDGIQDILIGADRTDPYGNGWTGTSYVIYGKAGGYTDPLDLASFNRTQGFKINGAAALDNFAGSVSAAGDVNGDGFPDILIGAYGASPYGRYEAGASYVIYGRGIKPSPNVSPSASLSASPVASFSASPKALPSAAFSAYPIASASTFPNTSPSASPSYSSASAHEVPWYSPAKWLSGLKDWWYTPESIDTTLPYIKEMLEIKARIKQASQLSSDRWFQFSLEDLTEDMNLILKNPHVIEKDTVKDMEKRLRGIQNDFLYEKPLQLKSHIKGLFEEQGQVPVLKESMIALNPSLASVNYQGIIPFMLTK